MTIHLLLYSTSHCHLCEQAESLLHTMANLSEMEWQSIEITEDALLLTQYETRIPVLKRIDNFKEIAWPFSQNDIHELIG